MIEDVDIYDVLTENLISILYMIGVCRWSGTA